MLARRTGLSDAGRVRCGAVGAGGEGEGGRAVAAAAAAVAVAGDEADEDEGEEGEGEGEDEVRLCGRFGDGRGRSYPRATGGEGRRCAGAGRRANEACEQEWRVADWPGGGC